MPADYGLLVHELIPAGRVCPLGPGQPNAALRSKLTALDVQTVFAGKRITDQNAARCCLAGLWLLHDFLDESHSLSQEIETVEGSYWHGIMHRREPDYGNGKYWFRRVGNHSIFAELLVRAKAQISPEKTNDAVAVEISQAKTWDPYRFIDWCEQLASGRARQQSLAERIAQIEWQLLFDDCYQRAIS